MPLKEELTFLQERLGMTTSSFHLHLPSLCSGKLHEEGSSMWHCAGLQQSKLFTLQMYDTVIESLRI
jgi:hypothetical protein